MDHNNTSKNLSPTLPAEPEPEPDAPCPCVSELFPPKIAKNNP